jgi:hypothetical protein
MAHGVINVKRHGVISVIDEVMASYGIVTVASCSLSLRFVALYGIATVTSFSLFVYGIRSSADRGPSELRFVWVGAMSDDAGPAEGRRPKRELPRKAKVHSDPTFVPRMCSNVSQCLPTSKNTSVVKQYMNKHQHLIE